LGSIWAEIDPTSFNQSQRIARIITRGRSGDSPGHWTDSERAPCSNEWLGEVVGQPSIGVT